MRIVCVRARTISSIENFTMRNRVPQKDLHKKIIYIYCFVLGPISIDSAKYKWNVWSFAPVQ